MPLTNAEKQKAHRQRQREKIARMEMALNVIMVNDQQRHWTATDDNPETHWEVMDGQYAAIARDALR